MAQLLIAVYPWIKALHIIAMVAWMAGLFYLPRVLVYHAERAEPGSATSETFKVMEAKLLRVIMTPAMVATYVFGLLLLGTPGVVAWTSEYWIYGKLGLVGLLTWFHFWCAKRRMDFERDGNVRSGRTFRLMNEVPTIALVGIVILVIVKPF